MRFTMKGSSCSISMDSTSPACVIDQLRILNRRLVIDQVKLKPEEYSEYMKSPITGLDVSLED